MERDSWTTAFDVGSCLAVFLSTIPMLGIMWLVPDEQSLSGHGVSIDRFLAAFAFFGLAAAVAAAFSFALLRRERVMKSGFWFDLWQIPCIKLFCFLDVPLFLLFAVNVRVR